MEANWVQKLIDLYSEGRADPEVRKALGITKRQWDSYIARSREFSELVEWGHELSESWHHEKSRDMVTNPNYTAVNANALKSRMANMYGWADKVDSRNATASISLDSEQLRKELKDRLPEVLNMIGEEKAALLLELKDE